jgi:hypothetical protein
MMPIDFKEANKTFTKPATMSDEECIEIRAYVDVDDFGYDFILTCWQPSKEDIEDINAGSPVYLKVSGKGMPPVCLFTLEER